MRRRPLILTAIGLAALVIAYAVYWFVLARIVAQDIAGWTGFYRSQGYAVSYEVPPLSRLPLRGHGAVHQSRYRGPQWALALAGGGDRASDPALGAL